MDGDLAAVIKREQVRLAGSVTCGTAQAAPSVGAQARIIRQDAEGVVVEVVCACGQRIHLNCTVAGE